MPKTASAAALADDDNGVLIAECNEVADDDDGIPSATPPPPPPPPPPLHEVAGSAWMFQKLAVVEALPLLTAAVVLEGVTADEMLVLLPGVVGARTIPVFNASCNWRCLQFPPPELVVVVVVGTAVLLDVELELLAWEASLFGGDMLVLLSHDDANNLFDADDTGLNKKFPMLPPKLLFFLG